MASSWIESLRTAGTGGDPERRIQFNRIGDATRRVIDSIVASKAPTSELETIATHIESVADSIERYPSGRTYEAFAEAANAGSNEGFLDFSPVSGRSNPLAPPVTLSLEVDEAGGQIVVGEVTFTSAYEGPPGSVHGGYLAAAFDEVLGLAQSMSGSPGMTARLTINYRKPTPWGKPLRFEARIIKREGRKVFTEGTCYSGSTPTAEADGLFVSVDFDKLAELAAARESFRSTPL